MLKEREDLLSQISGNTLRYRIKQWVDNFQANLPFIHGGRGVAGLNNMLAGLPAVVVGSGPTLDRNIKDLHLLKNKALIIACDSAVKALESFDVHADIIMVTDSKERVADFLRGIDIEKYSFVADTFIHPRTTELLQKAKRLYWYSTLPIDSCPFTGALNDWTGYVGNLGTGGCVATTAWWMASRLMQADPTILVGLPQAFYDPVQMYSSAVTKTVETEPYTSHLTKTFDIFGEACFTYPALQSFAWWFQDAFLQIPGLHINCSEGGIMQENCLNMPLIAAVQKYLLADFVPEEILFGKESIVSTMFQEGGERLAHLKEHSHLMEIIIDSPSLTNLSFRMGRDEKRFNETVDTIDALREGGFVIEESESQTLNPDGSPGKVARVFSLKGLELPATDDSSEVKMTIEITEARPMLIKLQELNLGPVEQAVMNAMSQGLPPMPVQPIAGMIGIELSEVVGAVNSLVAKDLVQIVRSDDPDATPLYVASHLMQQPPVTISAPEPVEQLKAPEAIAADQERYGDTATDPSITQKTMDNLRKKWLPGEGKTESAVSSVVEVEDGIASVYVASEGVTPRVTVLSNPIPPDSEDKS